EAGERTADVCRRHGISQATFYKYKSKYGGLEVSDARKLRALEDENNKLKKLTSDSVILLSVLYFGAKRCGKRPVIPWASIPITMAASNSPITRVIMLIPAGPTRVYRM
ncbi:MAG: transposase, partial [Rhodobacteraceae bacterium]|nr:transposase [Paracoccaceae bacterium]